MSDKNPRTYSAKERAKKNGAPNPAEDRTERELREQLRTSQGEPCFYGSAKGDEPAPISKVCAPFFAALYEKTHALTWEPEEQRFYSYEEASGLWRVQTEEQLIKDLRGFMLDESRRKEIAPGLPVVKMEERLCLKLETELVLRLKAEAERRDVFKRDADFSHGERFIHFANGVFVLRDGKPAGFRDGFSKLYYSRNRCPVNYDPNAECLRTVNEFLLPALYPETAEADLDLLFAFLGLGLLGFNLFQRILILQGASQSGKSTFGKLAALLVGEENTAQLRTHLLHERFELGSYIGRTLLLGADVNPKFFLSPGAEVLKALTGGDLMSAEMKQGNARPTFYGTFNVIVATNDELKVKMQGDRDAWERRLVIVPFRHHVPRERIRGFERLLVREEGSGIVNRALSAALAFLSGGDITLSAAQKRRVLDMLDRSDPVMEFAQDRITTHEGESLLKREIRDKFKDYCKDRRWAVPGDREIGSRLPDVMKELFNAEESNSVPDHTGRHCQGYRGVSWRTD